MITAKDIKSYYQQEHDPALTIFLPTHRAGEREKDQIMLKNALQEAEEQLTEYGLNPPERNEILDPIRDLLDDNTFWNDLSDTLMILANREGGDVFRLPIQQEKLVYTGTNYLLHPALTVATGDHRFFLLALSQNEVRLFEGHPYSIIPMDISDLVPADKDEVLADLADDARLQYHSASGDNEATPTYHGQGSKKDREKINLEKYLRAVDDGLMEILHDEHVPLVIAAVDYLVPAYKSVSRYPHIMQEHISGNPEEKDPVLLHEEAWNKVKTYFGREKVAKKDSFEQLLASDQASFSTPHIIKAAADKRIDTLFVVRNEHQWGRYDIENREVVPAESYRVGQNDLIDFAAMQTFLNGGDVYIVDRSELPKPTSNMNAWYRH